MTAYTFRELADREAEAEEVARWLTTGEPLQYIDDPELAAELLAQLPPRDAPHYVIRAVQVPLDLDQQARKMAAKRGVDPEDVLAEWLGRVLPIM